MTWTQRHRSPTQSGMTLIELMVAMVIGLGVVLAVSSLIVVGENHKRTTTSTNDAEQTGAYAFYAIDRVLRGAGSGLVESAYGTDWGLLTCRLNVGSFLPRATAFPAPFSTAFLTGAGASATATLGNLRVAPMLIGPNQSDAGSDVLVVMGGSGAAGGVSRQITGNGSATTLILDNGVGFTQYDLGIASQSNTTDCLLEEVNAINVATLTLGNTLPYYTAGATTTISTLATSTTSGFTPIGNASANNVQFQLIGVGANRTLFSYDLLQNLYRQQGNGTAEVSQPISDGVDSLHAIYGIAGASGLQTGWASPALDAGYDLGTVMTTEGTMKSIVSVRIALIVRGEYYDKNYNPGGTATLTYFSGLTGTTGESLTKSIVLSPGYRYRLFEFTVPLRNLLLLAGVNAS